MVARAVAQAPAVAVCGQRAVSRAQQGPAIRSPIRITQCPRIASAAAISALADSTRHQIRLIDQPATSDWLGTAWRLWAGWGVGVCRRMCSSRAAAAAAVAIAAGAAMLSSTPARDA